MVPHVSICIPAYEEASLLERSLTSVFQQDFTDFEVIVTDDSTSSAVEKAVARWGADSRMKYVRNETRLGSPANWNRALQLSQGRLIKVLHHDDWFSGNDSLGKFVDLIESEPAAPFAFCASSARDVEGVELFRHVPNAHQIALLERDPRHLLKANFVGAPSATIFRRQDGFLFNPSLKWLVDVDAYIRLLKNRVPFRYTPSTLINITVSSPRQVTRGVEADPALQFIENTFLYKTLQFRGIERLKYARFFAGLSRRLDTRAIDAVESDQKAAGAPIEVRMTLSARKTYLRLKRPLVRLAAMLGIRKDSTGAAQKSYSQCGEDIIIDFLLNWLGLSKISYLDIGANHPTRLNNSYFFYCKGCTGVLIEPDPDLHKRLVAARPRDRCLNIAVGVDGSPTAKLFMMTSRTLNTVVSSQASEYESYGRERTEQVIEVPQRGINEVLETEFQQTPNLVSLDVEGLDLDILRQWDFAKYRPEVFCIETLTFTQNKTEHKVTEIADLMQSQGYMQYADTYINTVFVSTAAWGSRHA